LEDERRRIWDEMEKEDEIDERSWSDDPEQERLDEALRKGVEE